MRRRGRREPSAERVAESVRVLAEVALERVERDYGVVGEGERRRLAEAYLRRSWGLLRGE